MDPSQFFVGFFAAIGLFNALLFLIMRDRPFAWYAAAMAAMIALTLIGADAPGVFRIVALCAYYVALVGFARSFLEIGRRFPVLDRVLITLLLVNLVGIIFEKVLPPSLWHDTVDDIFDFALLAVCVWAGIRTVRAGESSAKYFVIAFAGAVIGIAINDFSDRSYLGAWASYALEAGVAWEALFLALALADRLQFAVVDQLTGIPNRRALDAALERAFAYFKRTQVPLAVLMIDIDNFKNYNDQHGHPAGDVLLRDVVRAARNVCRSGIDTFARYGGEEFIAILPGADSRTAGAIAERMRADVARLTAATISVGVSLTMQGDATAARAVARADQALYAAKNKGKNRVESDPLSCGTMAAT